MHQQIGQKELQEAVLQWNHLWNTDRPVLQVRDAGRYLRIVDTRPCAHTRSWIADELESDIYRLCDSAQTPAGILKQLDLQCEREISHEEVEAAIQRLCENHLLLRLNGKLLGLGVNVPPVGDDAEVRGVTQVRQRSIFSIGAEGNHGESHL
jgi:hypothetical protein